MDNLVQVLSYAMFPVAATILGGIVAAFRSPGPKTRVSMTSWKRSGNSRL